MTTSYDTLIRVSKMNGRKESADSTMTLTDQRSLVSGELARVGGRTGKPFEALDQSGFTVLDSPAIEEILARVERGDSAGLVIAYGDRLARNAWDLGAFFKRLEKAGGELHDASMPGIDYRTPEGRQLTMMRGVASEGVYFAAKRRGDNVADQVVARGVSNAVPYGYMRNTVNGVKTDPARDAKALVPHPERAPIVRTIFARRLEGVRIARIAAGLNDAGTPSPRGKRWTSQTVATIVKNEVYSGVVILGARRNEDAHEPLLSKSDWRKAQGTRGVTLSGVYRVGVAGGLLVGPDSDRPLNVTGRPGFLSYASRGGADSNGHPAVRVSVSKRAADRFVLGAISGALDDGELALHTSSRAVEDARVALDKAKAGLTAWLEMSDVLTREELQAAIRPRRDKVEAAQLAYDEALAAAAATVEMPGSGSAFLALDEQRQRRVARSLIDRVIVSPPVAGGTIEDRFDVVWAHRG